MSAALPNLEKNMSQTLAREFPRLTTALRASGFLTPEQAERIEAESLRSNRPVSQLVTEQIGISEDQIAKSSADFCRVPVIDLLEITIDAAALNAIPQELSRKYACIAIGFSPNGRRKSLQVAMIDPTDFVARQELEFATSCTIAPVVAPRTQILNAIEREYAPDQWVNEFLANIDEAQMRILVDDDESEDVLSNNEKTAPVVKLLNLIIQQGILERASDIHLEATANHLLVRGRIQGILRDFMQVPKWLHEPVISRLKILARLDITDRRRPQDGRIKVSYEGNDVDLRVSTLPTHFGEKAVLRILGSGQKVPSTTELGLLQEELEILKRSTDQPQGLVLVTGPTGSGKTTTLYSILNEKRDPSINIITVEDPIEIQLQGINQVQVNTKAGLTFAASLRSMLRQDPDVILVGEIRDLETAEIAVHASQTGHLVLSTLHTNNTVATVTRLIELGLDSYLIATSLNLIIAQRLLRRLCEDCKVQHQPSEKDLRRLNLDPSGSYYRPKGCAKCNDTGYVGRKGIYELLRMTPEMRDLVARRVPEAELRKAAAAGGMKPLLECALDIVRQGQTSVGEVLRVVQLEEKLEHFCPGCRGVVDESFTACPFCSRALRCICSNCNRELQPEWNTCPFCRFDVAPATGASCVIAMPPNQLRTGPTEEPRARSLQKASTSPERQKIVIAEDDEMMRSIIVSALRMLPNDPEVLEVEDGNRAVEAIHEFKPDLLITDVNMPGMGGIELCERLRKNVATAFIPILMLTVSKDQQNRTRGYLAGTDDYMGKPFDIPELLARVGRLLQRAYAY
jgi:type IV pilus assembly protein PilB